MPTSFIFSKNVFYELCGPNNENFGLQGQGGLGVPLKSKNCLGFFLSSAMGVLSLISAISRIYLIMDNTITYL